jgi:hypothetical protein
VGGGTIQSFSFFLIPIHFRTNNAIKQGLTTASVLKKRPNFAKAKMSFFDIRIKNRSSDAILPTCHIYRTDASSTARI